MREIVKEESILRHETRFGVRLLPYLLSKLLLLGVFALIQACFLLLIVRRFIGLTGLFESQLIVLAFASVVGVVLGLLVSSFAGTSERAMTSLPVLLIAQAIFSGGLARLEGAVRVFTQIFTPASWSLNGVWGTFDSSLKNATYPGAPGHFQPHILGPGGPLIWDLLALFLQATLFAGIT